MKVKNNKYSKKYFLVVIIVIAVTAIVLFMNNGKEERYLVNDGTIELVTSCTGFVIKDETVMKIEGDQMLVPTISEGSRVSKNNIIATYRGNTYDSYMNKLKQLDDKILEAMKNIDVEYSIEVDNLEKQVTNIVAAAQGSSSMIEMQECKTNINNLLSKRASIIGDLSPKDAYVRTLITEREKLSTELQTSEANLKAETGGIISYSIDGLEGKLTPQVIMSLNYEDVRKLIEDNEKNDASKIKITSNYEAYILVRVSDVESEYIKKNKTYNIKVLGGELSNLKGEITKVTETEQGYEVLFRITNGVENIIEFRECEVDIVWTTYEGLVVPLGALKEKDDGKTYVTIITRGDYIDIPVIVQRKNETFAIVENYEKNSANDYVLERYDQVVFDAT